MCTVEENKAKAHTTAEALKEAGYIVLTSREWNAYRAIGITVIAIASAVGLFSTFRVMTNPVIADAEQRAEVAAQQIEAQLESIQVFEGYEISPVYQHWRGHIGSGNEPKYLEYNTTERSKGHDKRIPSPVIFHALIKSSE